MKKAILTKRFMSFFLALMLCFSLTTTVFAQNASSTKLIYEDDVIMTIVQVNPETGEEIGQSTAITKSYAELLWVNGVTWQGTIAYKVTPSSGHNLKLVMNNQGQPVKVKTYRNGGWWASSTITVSNVGTATHNLITNCNGETYTVKFTSNGGVASFCLVQTQYL